MRDAGIIGEDLGFAPAIGQQTDNELDRKTSAANDRLAKQYFRIDRQAWVLGNVRHWVLRGHDIAPDC